MIKIITKEDHSIIFTKNEIMLSNLLNNMFYSEESDNEEITDKIQELKIKKIYINELAKIKDLLSFIVLKNITLDKLQIKSLHYYDLIEKIKITPLFNCSNFFDLLNIVNFLDIQILLYLMTGYVKEIINDLTFNDVIEKFGLEKSNFSELENNRMNVINNLS